MRHLLDMRPGRGGGTRCACGRPLDRCWRYRLRSALTGYLTQRWPR